MGNGTQWRRSQPMGGGRQEGRAYHDGQRRDWQDRGSAGSPGSDGGQPGSDGPKKPSRGYKDLIAWQKAMELVHVVYRLAQRLPEEERAALGDHLCRAAISVPAAIAAGQGQGDAGEFTRALFVARGNLAELDTLLEIAVALGYLKPPELAEAEELTLAVRAISQKLVQRLRDGPKNNEGRRPAGNGRDGG